ncbi:MAG: NAD(P)-dependent oxidoreductase [Gammaproteobacteria bacterium]|nr:MAG: NAD(P)-dependent oxidoreductase [Gammaproteobacteria bacterium]RLA53686.1 MAG: NAD(P)-dependent oxidoreductase [Gammaproteobacteria bacterium]
MSADLRFNQKVGFIGLGNMGKPMAINLVNAGFELTVFDIRSEPLDELKKLGASVAQSVAEVAISSDIIELVVVNDAQLEEVVLGEKGILSAARPDSIIVIHATVHPGTCQKIAQQATVKNVGVLDAAVSGGEEGSKAGTLTLMVGGDPDLLERCRPVFEVVGENIFHLGDVGMGEAAKLVNNLMFLNHLHSAYEGLRLGAAAGIDEDKLIDLLKVSTGNSWALESWGWFAEMRESYTTGMEGMAEVLFKDLSLALSVGHDLKVSLPSGALTSQMLERILGLEE